MTRRLRAFLWLGKFLPLHGEIHYYDNMKPNVVAAISPLTFLGRVVASLLAVPERRIKWALDFETDRIE